MLSLFAVGLYAGGLATAAASDLLRYEIPNMASVAVLAAFLLITPALPLTISAVHLATGLAIFSAAALLFAAGVCGGGDVKLLGATAVWMGWSNLPTFLLLTALAGAVLAAALLILRRLSAHRTQIKSGRWYSRLLSEAEGVPYGVAIAAAGLALSPRLNIAALLPPALS